jgi:hypothetical protein
MRKREGIERFFGFSEGVFPGKVKQNPTMQIRTLSATDGLAIIYDKTMIISRVF